MRLRRRNQVRVTVVERTGDHRGRVTNMGPGDTMTLSHRVTIRDGYLNLDREYEVAEIRVER